MRRELVEAVLGFFAGLPSDYEAPPLAEAETMWLVTLADLAVRGRSAVERDLYSPSREIVNVWGAELPTRFVKVLAQLRIALLHIGVPEKRMWQLLRKVAFDSMPQMRRDCLDYLRAHDGPLSTRAVGDGMGRPTMSVRRALEELGVYGLVHRDASKQGDEWSLPELVTKALDVIERPPMAVPETREGGDGSFSLSRGEISERTYKTQDTPLPEFRVQSEPTNGQGDYLAYYIAIRCRGEPALDEDAWRAAGRPS